MNIDMPIERRYVVDESGARIILTFRCNSCNASVAEYPEVIGTLFQHAHAVAQGWRDRSTFDNSLVACPECAGTAKARTDVLEEDARPEAMPRLPGLLPIPVPSIARRKSKANAKSTGRAKWKGR